MQTSALQAFLALILFTFRRQWRLRQMGFVALGLLTILTIILAVTSYSPKGWQLGKQFSWQYRSRVEDLPKLFQQVQVVPMAPEAGMLLAIRLAPMQALLQSDEFMDDWAFLHFTRWIMFVMFLGFVLPLFTLAYASGAMGAEREGRTMIWMMTRPLPRWAIYLAKLLGVLPWSMLASMGGFVVLCIAGGTYGMRALETYWTTALVTTFTFTTLFHLLGTVFRKPAIVGLIYVFFFETLVASLPGSLKELSLNFYARSMVYNQAVERLTALSPGSLDVYAPTTTSTAIWTMLTASAVFTILGMILIERQESQDET